MESEGFSFKKLLGFDKFSEHVRGYIESRLELFTLEIEDRIAAAVQNAILVILVLVFASFCLLFSSIAFALLLGKYLESNPLGFFIVAAFYGILLIAITIAYQKNTLKPFIQKILDKKKTKNGNNTNS